MGRSTYGLRSTSNLWFLVSGQPLPFQKALQSSACTSTNAKIWQRSLKVWGLQLWPKLKEQIFQVGAKALLGLVTIQCKSHQGELQNCDGSQPITSSLLLLQFAHNCVYSVRRSSYGTSAWHQFWRTTLKREGAGSDRCGSRCLYAASLARAGGDGAAQQQQQHSDNKLNFKLIWERIPEERANHNYRLLSRRKDLSVIVGSAENISSAIGTAGTSEKKTTHVKLFCKSTGHVGLAPTSQKMLATQLEKAQGRIRMVRR